MSVLVVQGRCDILGQGGRSAKTRVQKHFATSHQISARAAPRRSLRALLHGGSLVTRHLIKYLSRYLLLRNGWRAHCETGRFAKCPLENFHCRERAFIVPINFYRDLISQTFNF